MRMIGIACILTACCLFIHLGMGDTINKITKCDFILFRCVKCLTFWSVLGYSLYISYALEKAMCVAFVCAYASLWIDLLLDKLAKEYEEFSKHVDAEEPTDDSGIGKTDKGDEGQKS